MLLLRTVIGIAVATQGGYYIRQSNPSPAAWTLGSAGLAAGILLLLGFLTPIVAALVAATTVAVASSVVPASTPSLFESGINAVFALTMQVALMALGPGAFSVDARLFGRREIIIPPAAPES